MGGRIINHQRQARELGRLRTGYSVPNSDPGKRPRPVKSKTWVVSSHAEHYVAKAAELYGGKIERWQPQGNGAPQFRVITEAEQLDAVLPGGDPLSQYNEMWSAGGCQRRCDGQTEQLSKRACLCLAQHGEDWHLLRQNLSTKDKVCAVTSRLNVVLLDMLDMGVWRAETHSFYAANEMAGTVDMVLSGTGGKGLVPVTLRIEPRTRVAGGQTKHFPVVVVEVRGVTPRQALSGPLPTAMALDPGAASQAVAAIEGPKGRDWIAEARGALTSDDVRDLWMEAQDAKAVHSKGTDPLSKQLMAIAAEKDAENATPKKSEPVPDEDGVYDVEVVAEEPARPAWPEVAQPRA